jgi:hypothetical protein
VAGCGRGGDLALQLQPKGAALPETPTVLTVLTAARAHRDQDPVTEHSHVLNSTTSVVPAAPLAEQMAGVGDWLPLAQGLADRSEPTFLDLGRIDAASVTLPVAARADVVITVARPDVASVVRLRDRVTRLATGLAQMRGMPPRLLPLLVTTQRHGVADVADLRRVLDETPAKPFLIDVGFIAHDADAVRRLRAGDEPAGRMARSNLMRTARVVVSQIVAAVPARTADAPVLATGGT